jgi:hypothetical protein
VRPFPQTWLAVKSLHPPEAADDEVSKKKTRRRKAFRLGAGFLFIAGEFYVIARGSEVRRVTVLVDEEGGEEADPVSWATRTSSMPSFAESAALLSRAP